MTAVIAARGVSKGFGGVAREAVLESADLLARGGTVSLVVGAPGSGKSALVRCLTGVYRPDAGAVIVSVAGDEVDLCSADARTVAWIRSHQIASFDGPLAAPPSLPAVAVVARVARCSRSAAQASLTRLGFADIAPVAIGRLRMPDRLAAALAAALIADRPFVVLDEPERFLEPERLAGWLHRAADAGAAVVLTAGPNSGLESVATTTVELRRGRIQ